MRFSASQTLIMSKAATIQYQVCSPDGSQPAMEKAGAGMPSGPPVMSTSWFSAMEMMMPIPSVPMAR